MIIGFVCPRRRHYQFCFFLSSCDEAVLSFSFFRRVSSLFSFSSWIFFSRVFSGRAWLPRVSWLASASSVGCRSNCHLDHSQRLSAERVKMVGCGHEKEIHHIHHQDSHCKRHIIQSTASKRKNQKKRTVCYKKKQKKPKQLRDGFQWPFLEHPSTSPKVSSSHKEAFVSHLWRNVTVNTSTKGQCQLWNGSNRWQGKFITRA